MAPRVVIGKGLLRASRNGLTLALPGTAAAVAAAVTRGEPAPDEGFAGFADVPPQSETPVWMDNVAAAGGVVSRRSQAIANSLIAGLKAERFINKIIYFLPLLGSNLAAARVPLIDRLGVGPAVNHNFVEGDFDERRGLRGDGASKYLDSLILPSQLSASGNGGIGLWENNVTHFYTPGVMAGYVHNPGGGTRAFYLYLGSTVTEFGWNQDLPGRTASRSVSPTNGHYYGQRSAADRREVFRNDVRIGFSLVSDPASDANFTTILLMALETSNVVPGRIYSYGRCACAYLTDGTMTYGDIGRLDILLRARLFAPLGRPQL